MAKQASRILPASLHPSCILARLRTPMVQSYALPLPHQPSRAPTLHARSLPIWRMTRLRSLFLQVAATASPTPRKRGRPAKITRVEKALKARGILVPAAAAKCALCFGEIEDDQPVARFLTRQVWTSPPPVALLIMNCPFVLASGHCTPGRAPIRPRLGACARGCMRMSHVH